MSRAVAARPGGHVPNVRPRRLRLVRRKASIRRNSAHRDGRRAAPISSVSAATGPSDRRAKTAPLPRSRSLSPRACTSSNSGASPVRAARFPFARGGNRPRCCERPGSRRVSPPLTVRGGAAWLWVRAATGTDTLLPAVGSGAVRTSDGMSHHVVSRACARANGARPSAARSPRRADRARLGRSRRRAFRSSPTGGGCSEHS